MFLLCCRCRSHTMHIISYMYIIHAYMPLYNFFSTILQRRRSISSLVAVARTDLCSSISENLDRLAIGVKA